MMVWPEAAANTTGMTSLRQRAAGAPCGASAFTADPPLTEIDAEPRDHPPLRPWTLRGPIGRDKDSVQWHPAWLAWASDVHRSAVRQRCLNPGDDTAQQASRRRGRANPQHAVIP